MADDTKTDTKADTSADTKTDTKTATTSTDTKTADTKADKVADAKADKKDDWRVVPDDWQDREDVATYIKNYNSPAEVARAALNAARQVSKAIIPLPKNPTPEDVAKYRKQVHIPETAEGYHELMKLEPIPGVDLETEGAKKMLGGFYKWAHDAHMTVPQVRGIMKPFLEMAKADATEREQKSTELAEAADAKLRTEWRHEYDANTGIGQKFVAAVVKDSPEFGYMLDSVVVDGMKLGDHPVMRRVASMLGRRMGEKQLATAVLTDKDIDEGKKSIEDLTKKFNEAMDKGDRKEADRIFKERRAQFERLHGPTERKRA